MAEQKSRTLTSFKELYPELRFLFIGDSGQGDYSLSKSLMEREKSPIQLALIHKLAEHQPGSVSDHPLIRTFDNYGEAASILEENGFLTADQAQAIRDECAIAPTA